VYSRTADQRHQGFDNASPDAPEQLSLLADILDGETFDVLDQIGVGDGARCWDIGSGNGSVAFRLAELVGDSGQVVASDLKPDYVPRHPRIETISQDIVTDPWPEPGFDLIHARLVLMHLADRENLAVRLADHLRPGGTLVLTDWYCDCDAGMTLSPVDRPTAEAWRHCHEAVHALGMDLAWAARTAEVLRAAGHTDVTTRVFQADGHGTTPSARLALLHTHMLAEHLAGSLTTSDLALIRASLLDPDFEMVTYRTYTTIVRT
jgi:SAM-dependent methyltransferase